MVRCPSLSDHFQPVKIVCLSEGDDADVVYYCDRCDPCPVCSAPPAGIPPPSYRDADTPAPRVRHIPTTVPVSLLISIFLLELYFQGGWRQLILPYIIGTVTCNIHPRPYRIPHSMTPLLNLPHRVPVAEKRIHEDLLREHQNAAAPTPAVDSDRLADAMQNMELEDAEIPDDLVELTEIIQAALGDLAAALTITDSGPDIPSQPSKLWTSRSQFQDSRAPQNPTSLNPIPISEAFNSIHAISHTQPKKSVWREHAQNVMAVVAGNVERSISTLEAVATAHFDVTNADHVAEMREKVDEAAIVALSAAKSLERLKECPEKAAVADSLCMLEARIDVIGACLPAETTPLFYDATFAEGALLAHLNGYFIPLIDQAVLAWNRGIHISSTGGSPERGRNVDVAFVLATNDLPASRKLAGAVWHIYCAKNID
ncbi:hypothetical protein C8R43DRAFT_947177 [Mycena crocata]|nr:hypothetical protein C8R43DRAFT_947177 [Mycena crocata]